MMSAGAEEEYLGCKLAYVLTVMKYTKPLTMA